jgi:hypothetical protein
MRRVLGERGAGLGPESRNDVERAFGQSGGRGEFGHAQQRHARIFGRLDDAGVAGRERAADRAAEDLQRIVPRNDMARDAVRLAPGEHRIAVGIRDRRPVQLVGRARVELEIARARRGIGTRLLERLAAIARLEQRELFRVIGDGGGNGGKVPTALGRRSLAPGAVMRPLRGAHGSVDVGRAAAGDCGEGDAFGWIDHRQRRTVARCDETIADEVLRRHGYRRPAQVRRVHRTPTLAAALMARDRPSA